MPGGYNANPAGQPFPTAPQSTVGNATTAQGAGQAAVADYGAPGYSAYYNSLPASTRAFMHAPGDAGTANYLGNQAAQSFNEFGGNVDQFGAALGGRNYSSVPPVMPQPTMGNQTSPVMLPGMSSMGGYPSGRSGPGGLVDPGYNLVGYNGSGSAPSSQPITGLGTVQTNNAVSPTPMPQVNPLDPSTYSWNKPAAATAGSPQQNALASANNALNVTGLGTTPTNQQSGGGFWSGANGSPTPTSAMPNYTLPASAQGSTGPQTSSRGMVANALMNRYKAPQRLF